jgi:hypothetical protein
MAQNNMDKGATALLKNDTISQLCDLVLAKLKEEILGRLPSKQRVVGSNPSRDAMR